MAWSKDRVLAFIKEFEKREILWKRDHKQFHNLLIKEDAWREISDVMNEEVDVLKKKMDSIRGSRRRQKSRLAAMKISGAGELLCSVPQ